jgi:hypothetical protein
LDHEEGHPRLTWPDRITLRHGLRALAVGAGWCAGLYFVFWLLHYEIDFSPDGPLVERISTQLRAGNGKLIGLSFIFSIMLLGLLLGVCLFVRGLLFYRGTGRRRLTFGDVLRYRAKESSSAQDGAVSHDAIRAVGVRRGGGLLIAAGATTVEIDPTLTSAERDWLAEVIRDWASLARPRPPDVSAPPVNGWLERDRTADGSPRLSWLPPEEVREPARRAVRRRALAGLAAWAPAEAALVALLAYLLLGNLDWLGCTFWLACVMVGLGLLICTPALLAVLAELVSLGRPARPESITLGADRLHHDPGHCYGDDTFSLGPPHDIDRAEITHVRLPGGPNEPVEIQLYGGLSQRRPRRPAQRTLAPAGDAAPIVLYRTVTIGACLRPFERAWLAKTLRWWAGLPSGEP